ncbi:hypothetical protein [Paenibacillus luteus]|nr:hypothetical protein [Paenibacillus luteus]
MKVNLTKREMEELAFSAIESAKRLGIPLKKKKKKVVLQLVKGKKK